MKRHWDETSIQDAIKKMEPKMPDSLSPKRVQKMLMEAKDKRKKPLRWRWVIGSVGTLVAAGILVFLFIPSQKKDGAAMPATGGMNSQQQDNSAEMYSIDMKESMLESTSSSANLMAEGDTNNEIEGFSTIRYDEIYERMQRYSENHKLYNIREYEMEEENADAILEEIPDTKYNNTSSKEDHDYSSTNIQVEGVDESNRFLTDGNYLYVMEEETKKVRILSANGEDLKLSSEIELSSQDGDLQCYYTDLYLDENRLIVLGGAYKELKTDIPVLESAEDIAQKQFYDYIEKTRICVYDITDRDNPILLNTLMQSGSYQNSRKVDGYLYVYSIFQAQPYAKREERDLYIPYADGKEVEEGSIYLPDQDDETISYMVMTGLSVENPDSFISVKAVLAGWSQFYVSRNNIYMVGMPFDQKENTYTTSKLIKFSYQNGEILPKASTQIPGGIESGYSLSEYQGYLRAVTNQQNYSYSIKDGEEYLDLEEKINGVYVYDDTLNLVGSIENIAPGEMLKSARFLGEIGYFVTFRETDPLFSVDFSDPTDPKLLGELKISGFSEYLHPYSDGQLFGIGYEADEKGNTKGIKLSMFDISDPANVSERHKLVLPNMNYSECFYNPKIVLVDPEKNLIGFSMEGFSDENSANWERFYKLFSYDPQKGFTEELSSKENKYSYRYYTNIQALYIGQYLYIIQNDYTIVIYNLNTKQLVS